ncbi:ABC transporter ATP-binding protein [Oscillochloris sp. ZM17-4]|uniref:ABC transporter ATP-binding protein n=1 Tax=Oscillochloris sp. ZM17-4 TaxID=2866714 RepID=UPI001C7312A8|nr:ABC transporter ATP-binding protein [Oscillochloris sp. ZM17-4]MBX0330407.1 ABC transporter ATP-binding protein [Oscillochloris sp. ZM17-4]
MALLELQNVHTYYGKIHALKGISVRIEKGEIVTLIGSNGAGKSTTLRTISGLLTPKQGRVLLNEKPIDHIPPHEIVKMGVAQSPEGRRIFPRLTVLENLEMGAYLHDTRSQTYQDDLERVLTLFPRLRERVAQKGGTLSGGEQQMLAIGRALMTRPSVLLLDEPSMGLAPVLVEQIFEIIQEINSQGMTVLLVEQNALQALGIANRGYVLQSGTIVLEDDAKALIENEMVQKAYLGLE